MIYKQSLIQKIENLFETQLQNVNEGFNQQIKEVLS